MPIIGTTQTYVVQTYRNEDGGFTIFLQMVDAEGRARFIIPPRVAQAIYRQRQSLTDKSTPASRAKARRSKERERKRKERTARKQAYAARNGNG